MKKLFTLFYLFLLSNLFANYEIKNFKLITIDQNSKTVSFSIEIRGNDINTDAVMYYGPLSQYFASTKIIGNYPEFTTVELTISIDKDFISRHRGLIPDIKDSHYSLSTGSTYQKFYYYPPDENYSLSSNIDVENFKIIDWYNDTMYFSFDIKGKYLTMTYAIYKGSVAEGNRLFTLDWNSDSLDHPIFYPEYFTEKAWHHRKTQVVSGKYFLVIDYWYNGVKQTKTLEFYKEPVVIPQPVKKNDIKISNVKIRKAGTSFSQPPMYDSSKPTTPTIDWAQQYEISVTVDNIGEEDINQQLSLLVKGYETTSPNSNLFIFTSNFPSIKKGSQIKDFPIIISQSGSSSKNSLEMLVQIDPSNTLNDKNLTDNKHTLKYNYRSSNGKTSELESSLINNIDVYNSTGNKIKSTSVNDLEQGLQDIKKSLPKGHYYFNVDGKKSQVQIK